MDSRQRKDFSKRADEVLESPPGSKYPNLEELFRQEALSAQNRTSRENLRKSNDYGPGCMVWGGLASVAILLVLIVVQLVASWMNAYTVFANSVVAPSIAATGGIVVAVIKFLADVIKSESSKDDD